MLFIHIMIMMFVNDKDNDDYEYVDPYNTQKIHNILK